MWDGVKYSWGPGIHLEMQKAMVRSKKTVVFKFIVSGESPKGNHKKRVYGEENGVVESLRWYFLMMRNRAQD